MLIDTKSLVCDEMGGPDASKCPTRLSNQFVNNYFLLYSLKESVVIILCESYLSNEKELALFRVVEYKFGILMIFASLGKALRTIKKKQRNDTSVF